MNDSGPNKLRLMLEMIRFSHTIFALPFAALAAVMAIKMPLASGESVNLRAIDLLALLLCMVFARSVAMAFNRLVDHKIDAANPRTSGRHLPANLLSRFEVTFFAVACGLGFVGSCAIFLPNWLPLAASVPVLAFLCGYSLVKRFTAAAHLWLGIALSLAPICVWTALRGGEVLAHPSDLLSPVLLAVAVAFWVTGFDIIYACQDEEFDRGEGLHSVPSRFGTLGAFRIAAASHFAMVGVLACLPILSPQLGLGIIYGVGVVAIAALLTYEHSIVRPGELQRINQAFFNVNAIVSVGLLAVAGIDCWLG